jgi:hypothetical protein
VAKRNAPPLSIELPPYPPLCQGSCPLLYFSGGRDSRSANGPEAAMHGVIQQGQLGGTRTKPLSRYWRLLRVIRADRSAVILQTDEPVGRLRPSQSDDRRFQCQTNMYRLCAVVFSKTCRSRGCNRRRRRCICAGCAITSMWSSPCRRKWHPPRQDYKDQVFTQ